MKSGSRLIIEHRTDNKRIYLDPISPGLFLYELQLLLYTFVIYLVYVLSSDSKSMWGLIRSQDGFVYC